MRLLDNYRVRHLSLGSTTSNAKVRGTLCEGGTNFIHEN